MRRPGAVGVVGVGALVLAGALAFSPGPAMAAPRPGTGDVAASVTSWDVAAGRLGTAGSLWEPMRTRGLERTRRIAVLGDRLTVANGTVTAGDTYAGTRYGRGARSVWVHQKWADTGWAAEPAVSTSRALVGTVRLPVGRRGSRTVVVARVYADCVPQPPDADPRPVPARTRCERSDVLRFGGTIELTARPSAATVSPGRTTIVVSSTGLTYRQLLGFAGSLQQVAGSAALGAGSAQMVGMCRQMSTGSMGEDAAAAFAGSNGYTLRVGSIDGTPLALTTDYRPDRFTVSIVAGAVTSCTYG